MTRARKTTHRGEIVGSALPKHKLRQTSTPSEAETNDLLHSQAVEYKYVSTTAHYTQLSDEVLRKITIDVNRKTLHPKDDE